MQATMHRRAWASLGAALLVACPGCGQRVEALFGEMHQVEKELKGETRGFRGDIRVLQPSWDVQGILEDAARYDREFLDLVRERFRIQDAYHKGDSGRVEALRRAADFLRRARDLVDEIRGRRDEILAMRDMTDEVQVRFSEISTLAATVRESIAKLADRKKRLLFESRLMAAQKGMEGVRPLLEAGMRQMPTQPEPARVAYRAGLNKLAEIERAIRDLLAEIRGE